MTLDQFPLGRKARILGIDAARLAPDEVQRLQALGIDVGAEISVAHCGVFGGRDPLAVNIGRMVVALRSAHARALLVEAL